LYGVAERNVDDLRALELSTVRSPKIQGPISTSGQGTIPTPIFGSRDFRKITELYRTYYRTQGH